jgi:tetratricopeptide (TPR) repeat protein
VQAAGNRIRVSVQLSDALNDSRIWGQEYDQQFTDIFKMQDAIVADIVRALQANLAGAALPSIAAKPPTADIEAYNLYLQGVSLLGKGTLASFEVSRKYFEDAIKRDPKFARAYAGLASTYMVGAGTGIPKNLRMAEAYARRALDLDPANAPDARTALAGIRLAEGRVVEAMELGRAELEANPNEPFVRAVYANHVGYTGHLRESLALARQAYAASPAEVSIIERLALSHMNSGERPEALRLTELARSLSGSNSPMTNWVLLDDLVTSRRFAEAQAVFAQTHVEDDSGWARTERTADAVFAALGNGNRRSAARAAANEMISASTAKGSAEFNGTACNTGALLYSLLGDMDGAYQIATECLDRAKGGALAFETSLQLPIFRPFIRDRRFQAYAERVGLMEYWRKAGPPDYCDLNNNMLTCR